MVVYFFEETEGSQASVVGMKGRRFRYLRLPKTSPHEKHCRTPGFRPAKTKVIQGFWDEDHYYFFSASEAFLVILCFGSQRFKRYKSDAGRVSWLPGPSV